MKIDTLNIQISEIIKSKAKSLGFTQSDLADDLKVSIPTVKRWYAGKGFTLSALQQLADHLGFSLTELFASVENDKVSFEYSREQEEFLSGYPDHLALFDNLLRGKSVRKIQSTFNLTDKRLNRILLNLDKLELIELHSGNKVKMLKKGEPIWRKGGPLSKEFKNKIVNDYLDQAKAKEVSFYIHDYLTGDLVKIHNKVEDLKSFLASSHKRAAASSDQKKSFGALISLSDFTWDIDEFLKTK